MTTRKRLRDLGLSVGRMPPGRWNAITDVPGVRVGYANVRRQEPSVVCSGVTAIWPRDDVWTDAVFAGVHSFNGYGDMTGIPWVDEQGLVDAPICITNTYSVGIVRDAVIAYGVEKAGGQDLDAPLDLHMPVVTETYDGFLSDIESYTVTAAHAYEALDGAVSGPIAEGNVGGGSGMVCHEFKGGTGTASRTTEAGHTVGCLVQANYGRRDMLRVDGARVGEAIGLDRYPSPWRQIGDGGSIIVVLATDAPLLPIQCRRLARRATTGLAWTGGFGANTSGDLFLAFSTGNHVRHGAGEHPVTMLAPEAMDPLFEAAAEATHEAILNALCMAQTVTGHRGRTAHAIPLDELAAAVRR